eukprot:CAMPEP_0197915040 /NCGR_PEP_ID=MMETSP1439-20131203/79527_1 /TAXON_ID=66791 /ORGANISM="Gonyaulax spinifera, Strain CCMP409" /LENGTH=32 /DNA_ID= /DNA_START= /DNA_END= /DNA_ORIENTATION=
MSHPWCRRLCAAEPDFIETPRNGLQDVTTRLA